MMMPSIQQTWLIAALCLSNFASATEYVLYREGLEGDISARYQRVAHTDGQVEYIRFDDLITNYTPTITRGLISGCSKSNHNENFQSRFNRGKTAIQYEDFDAAEDHLQSAEQLFRCSTTIVEPYEGAELYLLFGILAHHQGDLRAAQDRFERAFLFKEDLAWNNDYPNESREAFEKARWSIYERAPARVYIEPDYNVTLHLNGKIPDRTDDFYLVPSGEHLLQFKNGAHTYSVSFESGESTLAPPILEDPAIFHEVLNPEKHERLVSILSQLFPEKTKLFLADRNQLWEHTVGETEFTDRWKMILESDRYRRKRAATAWTLVGSGTLIAAGSTAAMVIGLQQAANAQVVMEDAKNAASRTSDPTEVMNANNTYQAAYLDYGRAYTLNIIGAVSAVGGGMLAGGGITLLATSSTRLEANGRQLSLTIRVPKRRGQ
jgi:tetratricopeptide (TPR) repeat protein